jgi:uncharacterized phage protein (TIGR01671 family)
MKTHQRLSVEMSKELKFRVWDIKKKRFVFNKNTLEEIMEEIYDLEFLTYVWKKNTVWQQNTGLLDKNNKEIYEGDIVKISYTPNKSFVGEVEWLNEKASYVIFDKENYEFFDEDNINNIEILGNAFEKNNSSLNKGTVAQR